MFSLQAAFAATALVLTFFTTLAEAVTGCSCLGQSFSSSGSAAGKPPGTVFVSSSEGEKSSGSVETQQTLYSSRGDGAATKFNKPNDG